LTSGPVRGLDARELRPPRLFFFLTLCPHACHRVSLTESKEVVHPPPSPVESCFGFLVTVFLHRSLFFFWSLFVHDFFFVFYAVPLSVLPFYFFFFFSAVFPRALYPLLNFPLYCFFFLSLMVDPVPFPPFDVLLFDPLFVRSETRTSRPALQAPFFSLPFVRHFPFSLSFPSPPSKKKSYRAFFVLFPGLVHFCLCFAFPFHCVFFSFMWTLWIMREGFFFFFFRR